MRRSDVCNFGMLDLCEMVDFIRLVFAVSRQKEGKMIYHHVSMAG
jgi:hypothetical protein